MFANVVSIEFSGPPVSNIFFLAMFRTHSCMNVMTDFMKQDLPKGDLANQFYPRTFATFEA